MHQEDPAPVVKSAGRSLAVFTFENLLDPSDPQRYGQILQELLIADLSALEPLEVYSSQRLYDIQKLLNRQATRADKNLTTAVATRAGARTMLTGSLGQMVDRWVVACQLVDVEKGTVIQSKRLDGTNLFAMVDQL